LYTFGKSLLKKEAKILEFIKAYVLRLKKLRKKDASIQREELIKKNFDISKFPTT